MKAAWCGGVGQRALDLPARHGARSSGSGWRPKSVRRARLALRRPDHAAPTFDEEREFQKRMSAVPPPLVDHLLERRFVDGLEDNLRRQLTFIGHMPLELQSLGHRRDANDSYERVRSATASTADEAVALALKADAWISYGVYILPAKLHPATATRTAPGWHDLKKGGGTTDTDVTARRILAIDFDVQRPSGTSATDEELRKAVHVALGAWDYVVGALGGESSLAYLNSGNGRQIHIALDNLPNDEETKHLCTSILVGLASLFDTPEVKVDRKLFDAKRILPACGTIKKKGAAGIEERPHRRTAIVTPETVKRLSLEELKVFGRGVYVDIDDDGKVAMTKAMGGNFMPSSNLSHLKPGAGSPFDTANSLPPMEIAEWLGVIVGGTVVCPGCGSTDGVAVISRGLKCHHNRCASKGKGNGFRNNVDLAAEVLGLMPNAAVMAIGERFGFEVVFQRPQPGRQEPENQHSVAVIVEDAPPRTSRLPRGLGENLARATARARRRMEGKEKPIPLPWPVIANHYGGGFWPGVHFICAGTGVGKTAACLQIALHAATNAYPVAYIGLEMDEMQIGVRLSAERADVPWSTVYIGKANEEQMQAVDEAAAELTEKNLPFHSYFSSPQGWSAKKLEEVATDLRAEYPETDGPGSRPFLIILDFLQIVGDESEARQQELRERIGRAAYFARDVASRFNAVVLILSSIAREKYSALSGEGKQSGLTYEENEKGQPFNRKVKNPDAYVGLGKESGEIEYSADSVSAIALLGGEDIVWITAKGRATGAMWSPLRFTGFRYETPPDGGAGVVATMKGLEKHRQEIRADAEAAKARKASKLADKLTADAILAAKYIMNNPECGARDVTKVLGNNQRRWAAAKKTLGEALAYTPARRGKKAKMAISVPALNASIASAVVN